MSSALTTGSTRVAGVSVESRMRIRRRMMANSTSSVVDSISAWQASRKPPFRYASDAVRGDRLARPWRTSTTHSRQRPVRRHDWGTALDTASA